MGCFSDLLSRLWRHADAAARTTGTPADTSASAAPAAPASSAPAVDRAAVLNGLAATHTETLDWQHSIVDLLKLVGMDSSLTARKELATELGYTGKLDGAAALHLWLHKAVMQKLADNGGQVPQALRH
jgi:hypothetical protein